MIRIFTSFLLFISVGAIADGNIEGMILEVEEKYLTAGETYTVPACKKLMLMDTKNYSELTWLKITGGIEVKSALNGNAVSHIIEGSFTYNTEQGDLYETTTLLPQSTALLQSKESVSKVPVKEFTWQYKKGSACSKQNS